MSEAEKNAIISELSASEDAPAHLSAEGILERALATVERIENRRDDSANRQREAEERSDKRHFDFGMKRIEYLRETENRRITIIATTVYLILAIFVCLVVFILSMLFFGDEPQRDLAFKSLLVFGVGVFIHGIIQAFRFVLGGLFKREE